MLKEKLQDLLLYIILYKKKTYYLSGIYWTYAWRSKRKLFCISGETSWKDCHFYSQVEVVKDKGYDVLYLTDNVDEFCFKWCDYKEKPFKSVAQGDLDIDSEEEKKELEKLRRE